MNAIVYVAYNTDGDCEVSTDGASEAVERLTENYGACEGVRVIELNLTLPAIKAISINATIPDTDGEVSVTVAA